MKFYFFPIMFCLFIHNQGAFGQVEFNQMQLPTKFPAIEVSSIFSDKIFMDPQQKLLNCPMLFNNNWNYPNGSSLALCDDAQLACLRYGLIIEKMKMSTGLLLAELQKVFIRSKEEVELKLRGCELVIEATGIDTKTMQEAAGYPMLPVNQY